MTERPLFAHGLTTAALVLWCAAGCFYTASPVAATQIPGSPVIVALGDSLTSGQGLNSVSEAYPARLEQMFVSSGIPARVLNHGVSGDTTAEALRRLPAALAEQPTILIVALGANDGLRGVPISQVRANLETIISTAQQRRVAVLLCGMETLPVHGWEYMVQFHQLFPALADRYRVPLVPFLLDGVVANERMLLPDFVHPNAAGALQIARTIWPYLQPMTAAAVERQMVSSDDRRRQS